ncbi:hypothetical protein KFE94_14130 [bacterium SCSIO 12643]|nr:hypothetical protein KFE94_14130 [bacterium SCSIO 12643]
MRKILFVIVFIFALVSCRDKCRYVDPVSICGADLRFEILDSLDINFFDSTFQIDSFQIINDLGDTIPHNLFIEDRYWQNDLQFSFEIFDCGLENEKFNQTITKTYLLRFSSLVTDTMHIEFKPIDQVGECGGTNFHFLRISYNDSIYDGTYYSSVNTLYR